MKKAVQTVATAITTAPVAKTVAKAISNRKVAPPTPVVPELAENETPHSHRRFTLDASVKEWRVVRSQRKEFDGYFVQGGEYRKGNRGAEFHVAREFRYATLQEAKVACSKMPSPNPVAPAKVAA